MYDESLAEYGEERRGNERKKRGRGQVKVGLEQRGRREEADIGVNQVGAMGRGAVRKRLF